MECQNCEWCSLSWIKSPDRNIKVKKNKKVNCQLCKIFFPNQIVESMLDFYSSTKCVTDLLDFLKLSDPNINLIYYVKSHITFIMFDRFNIICVENDNNDLSWHVYKLYSGSGANKIFDFFINEDKYYADAIRYTIPTCFSKYCDMTQNIISYCMKNYKTYSDFISKIISEEIRIMDLWFKSKGILHVLHRDRGSSVKIVLHSSMYREKIEKMILISSYRYINIGPTFLLNLRRSKTECIINDYGDMYDLEYYVAARIHKIVIEKQLILIHQKLKNEMVLDISTYIVMLCFNLCYFDWDLII